MVTLDGGLERLVQILRVSPRSPPSLVRDLSQTRDMQANWKWSLAFQCVVNIGVRGSEAIRTRVVEAGMVPIIVRVLENYLECADLLKEEQQRLAAIASLKREYAEIAMASAKLAQTETQMASQRSVYSPSESRSVASMEVDMNAWVSEPASSGRQSRESRVAGDASASASDCAEDVEMGSEEDDAGVALKDAASAQPPQATPRAAGASASADARTPRAAATRVEPMPDFRAWFGPPQPVPVPVYREEEVLLSLQLLAYLSKYPHVRHFFHNADVHEDMLFFPEWLDDTLPNESWQPSHTVRHNVFSIAERFTHRPSRSSGTPSMLCSLYPRFAPDIQYWAGVVMRNACRKDESRGGIRQCANMLCGKWESYPREFAKCRRCRKAKYCSKQCQSKGWQMGHRFWCSARTEEGERPRDSRPATEASTPQTAQTAHGEQQRPTPLRTEPQPMEAETLPSRVSQPQPQSQPLPMSSRPLGVAPRLPSTLRHMSQHLPALRGVSAASVETNDPSDMSDDAGRTEDATSPAVPAATSSNRAPPPPIIAGELQVQDTDPAAATLRAQEAQNVQENGPLDLIAASWSPAVGPVPDVGHEPQPSQFDLGIRMSEGTPQPPTRGAWHGLMLQTLSPPAQTLLGGVHDTNTQGDQTVSPPVGRVYPPFRFSQGTESNDTNTGIW